MQNLEQKTLTLFFSKGISLKNWEDIGHADRELKFYNSLAKNFSEVYFFTYGANQDLKFQERLSGKLKVFPKKYRVPGFFYYLLLPFFYRKELKQSDILKTNQMSAVLPAIIAKWFFKKKLVVRCGYEWLNVLEKEKKALWKRLVAWFLERLAYNSADKIILTSQKDKAFVQQRFKILSEKIEIIPNYIDTNLFKPSLLVFNTNRDANRQGVVYVGRLSREKNLLNLVRAVGALPRKLQQMRLTLIGQGSLENELRELAAKVGVNVEFKGRIANKELPVELNKHKVFILPSFYEGCPKALLEAMSCGLPCIGTNVEGINEIIVHQENGLLVNIDAESIRKGLQELFENQAMAERLGRQGRQTIMSRFSLDKILQKEVETYVSLYNCH